MPTCPTCSNAKVKITKGEGRFLSGYAMSARGALLEIPGDIEIPECSGCGIRLIDEDLAGRLLAFEKRAVEAQGGTVPIHAE